MGEIVLTAVTVALLVGMSLACLFGHWQALCVLSVLLACAVAVQTACDAGAMEEECNG